MQIVKARVDGQIFILAAGYDIAELKASIVLAAREGADFVEFSTVGHGLVSVLITSTIPVRFETIDRTEEQMEQWADNPPPIDVFIDADEYWGAVEV
jgi:hypothetical protein